MARQILLRVGHAVLSVLILVLLTFFLVRLTGDPTAILLPEDASPEMRDHLRVELGLDEPLPQQLLRYVGNLARGDLGDSFRSRSPVIDMVIDRLGPTVTLGMAALLLTIIVSIPLGIYAAYWPGSPFDVMARGFSALGQAVPSFWLGFILILVFAIYFRVLPSGGYGGPPNIILPTITLAVAGIAGLTRFLRSSMIEVLSSDYITFHRLNGLPEREILWKHGLRNAGLTTLSYLGLLFATLITGSVLVETVFVWPGIGRLMVEGVRFRDFNVIQSVTLLVGTTYIVVNLMVDVLYTVLNPRLR